MSQPHEGPDRESAITTAPATPRWVKVSGIVVAVVVLLVIIMLVVGGGQHSPSRHLPSSDGAGAIVLIAHRMHAR